MESNNPAVGDMNVLPVSWVIEQWWRYRFTPQGVEAERRWNEEQLPKIKRIREGTSTFKDEFEGTAGVDELQKRMDDLYDQHPEVARHYRLPRHWHWMGERE